MIFYQNSNAVFLKVNEVRRQFLSSTRAEYDMKDTFVSLNVRVSVQGVESLWGDCRFILADWGSQ